MSPEPSHFTATIERQAFASPTTRSHLSSTSNDITTERDEYLKTMQFRLWRLFLTITFAAIVLATATASSWQLALFWTCVVIAAAVGQRVYLAHRDQSCWTGVAECLYILSVVIPAGILGLIAGLTVYQYSGHAFGYPQSFLAGVVCVIAVGTIYPAVVRNISELGWMLIGGR